MALLPQPVNVGQNLSQQTEDFKFDAPVTADDAALALVIQDTQRAEKFMLGRLWYSEFRIAKAIYEAPVRQDFWRDTLIPRASNSFPLCAQHIRAIQDAVMPALFPDNPPFAIAPNEGTPAQVARGWELIVAHQLREAQVKQQMRLVVKDAEVFGTGIGKFGWEQFERTRTVYRRKVQPTKLEPLALGGSPRIIHTKESDELEAVDVTETVSRPYFHRCELTHTLVDPATREPNCQKASYIVYRDYLTLRDINRLRDFEGYDIPSEEELAKLAEPPKEEAPSSHMEVESTVYPAQGHRPLPRYLDSSQDPLEHKLEVLEHWTADQVIVVLQRKLVIRKERNPFGILPFLSCFWDDVPQTFYGFGIPKRIGGVQTHIQGLRNLRLDDINLNLQNVWLMKKGTDIPGQPLKMYPGAIWKVSDINGMKPMLKQPVLSEAYQEEGVLIADAEKTTGANELLIQGAMPAQGRSSIGRTATGAGLLGGASSSRVQGFVEVIADQVFLPLLYAFVRMDRELLDPAVMRKIVGEQLWSDMEAKHDGDDLTVDVYNGAADIQFNMHAASSIAARKNMAQSLPLEVQMLETPAFQDALGQAGYKINVVELGRRFEQATGWKSPQDLYIPLSDEEKQNRMQQSKPVMDAKATQARLAQMHQQATQLEAQKHQQRMSEISQKGMANAGQEIITRALERAQVKEEEPQMMDAFGGET